MVIVEIDNNNLQRGWNREPSMIFEDDGKPSPLSMNNNAHESIICTIDAYNLQIIFWGRKLGECDRNPNCTHFEKQCDQNNLVGVYFSTTNTPYLQQRTCL